MMKLLKLFAFICIILLAGCAKAPPKPKADYHKLHAFNKIKTIGLLHLVVKTKQPNYGVHLRGAAPDLEHITAIVADDVLNIKIDKGYPKHGPIYAEVHTKYINAITTKGAKTVTARNVYSELLDLNLQTQGDININGKLGIRKLYVDTQGRVKISGVNSRNLDIYMEGEPKMS